MAMDYFTACAALGLSPGAALPEIKSAYRRLSKELHPDNLPEGDETARERFLRVSEAYDYLERLLTQGMTVPSGMPAASVPSGGGTVAAAPKARVFGSPVSYHTTSAEERALRKQREEDYRKEQALKREKQREEVAARAEQMKAKKEQARKERELLNEIRMIRLAHIIQAMLAAEKRSEES